MANLRQQKVLEMIGKGWNLTQAMKRAGYSKSYIRNNQKFKSSESWDQLTEKYFDNETLLKTHQKLLNAKKFIKINNKTFKEDDYAIITKALDMAYKIKGYYKDRTTILEDRPFKDLSDNELEEMLEEATKELKKS